MASSQLKQNYDWDMESTILLINLYKENECLYNNSHEDYKNRDVRQTLMSQIASEIEDATGKLCTVIDIRKKVNTLRSQYLVEKQKIVKANNTGDEYTPRVYWFPLLYFLDSYSNGDLSQYNLDSINPSDELTDLPLIKSLEQEPPKPPKRRKKYPSGDSMSVSNFSINKAVSNMPSNESTGSTHTDTHIITFCNFLKSELICIRESGGEESLKKAKRKLQLALFEVWDEMESFNGEID